MPRLNETNEPLLQYAVENTLIDKDQDSYKKMIRNNLYTVYLLSSSKPSRTTCHALLIEHLPAKGPAAHVLPLTVTKLATNTELLKDVAQAVDNYFSADD